MKFPFNRHSNVLPAFTASTAFTAGIKGVGGEGEGYSAC